jgi:selenocysteine-specific elongation factor
VTGVQTCALPISLKHNIEVSFHSGSAETLARVRLLDRDQLKPGDTALVQIRFEHPLALVRGDLFIVRSPNATLGGGAVLEPHAQRHRRRDEATLGALAALEHGSPEEILANVLKQQEPLAEATLVERSGLPGHQARQALANLLASGSVRSLSGAGGFLVSPAGWEQIASRVRSEVQAHHRQHPLRWGMPREELRSRLGVAQAGDEAIAALVREGALEERGPSIRLPGQEPSLTPAQEARLREFLAALEANPYSPPGELPDPDLLGVEIGRAHV